ncbi:hypothetical protein AVEN_214666-1 [Araneus ventricosus]|uniref:Uncharacterized protein n=1 Tax=Araneus ventricosus TaxID=182803 RepID=A0A4Y2TW45_ARAVE|nr:hypothetical protein AVEN_214666-1 [Araneus ventricosus]
MRLFSSLTRKTLKGGKKVSFLTTVSNIVWRARIVGRRKSLLSTRSRRSQNKGTSRGPFRLSASPERCVSQCLCSGNIPRAGKLPSLTDFAQMACFWRNSQF